MKARYIATSDPTDDQVCDVFGSTFALNKWQAVSDEVGARLATNGTFEVQGAVAPAPEIAPEPSPSPE